MAGHGGDPAAPTTSSSSSAAAPKPERWYPLKLGSTFSPSSSAAATATAPKFYSLRYEFKPASIDKTQDGSLQKTKENRVMVEFHNNQVGKPKVAFEGSSEDYKDNDGVLFFDGETFRLERLHRAVKRLRHVRQPGESVAPANTTPLNSTGLGTESRSPPLGKMGKPQNISKTPMPPIPIEVERIDIGEPRSPGPKPSGRFAGSNSAQSNRISISPENKNNEEKSPPEENNSIIFDDDEGTEAQTNAEGFDINVPNQNDTDDEIVDVSDDEGQKGPNAAEALRAQVNAEEGQRQQSSSSSESSTDSGSSRSGSGSGSSSSDTDASDDNSASSAGDDIADI